MAERGVKLITDYAEILTKDKVTRELLLQRVEMHRRKFPDFQKETVVSAFWTTNDSVLDYIHLHSACLSAFCVLGRISNSIDQNNACAGSTNCDTHLKCHIVIDMAPNES